MLSSKGLLLFDYDGTLVDGSIGIHEISDATVEALCQARSNGYLTVLASGRSIGMVEPVKHLFDGFITTNGAYAQIKGKEYHNRTIDKDVLRRMMEFFQDKHDRIYANVETQDDCYVTKMHSDLYERIMEYFGLDRSKFSQWEGQYDTEYNKLTVMYSDRTAFEELYQSFGEELEIIDHPLEDYAEIMPKGCTKGSALRAVMNKSGMPADNIYAFGDSENDYTMLQAAGHAIIMGKHSPIVEEVADFVTLRVEEEGIPFALKHYGIIE